MPRVEHLKFVAQAAPEHVEANVPLFSVVIMMAATADLFVVYLFFFF